MHLPENSQEDRPVVPPAGDGLAERLIRRLRVSDSPDRFQRRAVAAVREALGASSVAFVSDRPRDPIVLSDAIPSLNEAVVRQMANGPWQGSSEGVCPTLAGIDRWVVVSVEGEGGRLLLINPPEGRPSEPEMQSLRSVVTLIGTQRSNSRIYTELKDLLFGVIRALTAAIDAKDPYTSGHSERVARIAVRIGQELGISPHDQGDLYLMGLLHDVGKIGVDDGILKKPGRLDDEEMKHIQSHVRIGVHILSDLKKLQHLLPGVAYHHEKLDGTGYPAGLKGDAIPLSARILAAADSFDAMSSSRPYRRKMTPSQIEEEFRRGAGRQWDKRVVDALFACRDDIDAIQQKGLGESLHHAIVECLMSRN